jgi:hypothetical protein
MGSCGSTPAPRDAFVSAYRVSPNVTDADLARAARGRIAFERKDGALVLTWWWTSRLAVPWLAGMLLFGFFTWAQRAGSLFSFPFVVCAGLTLAFGYLAFAHLFNRTRVVVNEDEIAVKHGPIPWPGGDEVRVADLEQLFVEREVYGTTRRSRTVEFRVRAKTRSGRDVLVVNGPMSPDRARAIEATIEAYLQIADAPVSGELDRAR